MTTLRNLFITCLLALPLILFADNGIYPIGWGAKSRGIGGAAVAYAQDTFGAIANPAGLTDLDNRIDGAFGYIYHTQKLRVFNWSPLAVSFGSRDALYPINGSRNAILGEFGACLRITECITAGLLFTPQAGGVNIVQGAVPAILPPGASLSHHQKERVYYAALTPCIAFRFCEDFSFGIGVDFTGAAVNAKNFQSISQGVLGSLFVNNGTAHPNHVSNKGWDWAWGCAARLGFLWHVFPSWSFGASYRTKTFMSRFKRYEGLISPQGRADLPEILSFGLAYRPFCGTTLAFDYCRIYNHCAPAFGNKTDIIFVDPTTFVVTLLNPHGANNGSAFGWKNRNVYKVGICQDWGDCTFRVGYNYSKSPIPRTNGTLSSGFIPAAVEQFLTLGGTWAYSPCTEFSFAYVHGFKHTVKGFVGKVFPAEIEAQFLTGKTNSNITARSDFLEFQMSWFF